MVEKRLAEMLARNPMRMDYYKRGVDAFGHFHLESAPRGDLDDAAQAAFARSYEGYRAAYAEQVTTTPSA